MFNFNKNPEVTIADLKVRDDLIDQLSKRIWVLENPPQLKIGQNINFQISGNCGSRHYKGVITNIEVGFNCRYHYCKTYWRNYSYFDGREINSFIETAYINRDK